MNDNGKSPAATIGPIDPLSLGAALARSVLERSRDVSPGIVEFAARMNVLWARSEWCATERGWRSRLREYQHLLSEPHPGYGRAYGVGRVFARLCGASHDVPVIELGATAFVEQLAPILGLLRTIRVAGAGEVAPA